MRLKLNWLSGSFLAFGCAAICVTAPAKAADAPDSGTAPAAAAPAAGAAASGAQADQRAALALPAGAVAAKESTEAGKLNGSLETATEDALKKEVGMGGIRTCFVEQDRARLKDLEKIDCTTLNAQAEAIAKAWQDKYKQEFAFEPAKVFSGVQAVQGQIEDPQTFVQNWPAATVGGAQGEAQQAAAKVQMLDDDTQKNGFIKKGTDIAIVRIPAEGNSPALDVSLINEPQGWKLDVPNSRTAQQIHDDLEKHLTMLNSDTTKWPADADQARRAFVSHVIMAIYGVDAMPAAGAAPVAPKPQ